MASSSSFKVSLYFNTIGSEPLLLDCPDRFAMVNPCDHGGSRKSEMFAILSTANGDIQTQVKDGVTIGVNFHFILDSTLSTRFLFVANQNDFNYSGKDTKSKSNLNMVELSDSSSDEIVEIVGQSSNHKLLESPVSSKSMEDVWIEKNNKEKGVCSGSNNLQKAQSTMENIVLNSHLYPMLSRLISRCAIKRNIDEVPQVYNGDCVYELEPIPDGAPKMVGMEQKYDGHCWVKPVQSRMKYPAIIRRSKCSGHIICSNDSCSIKAISGQANETSWTGKLTTSIVSIGMMSSENGSLRCFYCGQSPILLQKCPCVVYYILTANNWTRLFIHSGRHEHPVAKGVLRSAIRQTRDLVCRVVSETPTTGPRHLQLNIAKQMVMGAIVRENGEQLTSNELLSILEEMQPLIHTQRFKHLMKEATIARIGFGAESQLLRLKNNCGYKYFHSMMFPGQTSNSNKRCHVFKMSVNGPGSGVELVNRMRQEGNGDLRKSWVCFDHVRRVVGWTTMAAHVYDPTIQEMQTIAICEMKEEDTQAQISFWEMMNAALLENGHHPADFRGFMADEAGANWRAIRSVFNGGPKNVMEGRERSCLFHWEQSLHIHTMQYVHKNFQDDHKRMCELWRCARNEDEATNLYKNIRAWWASGKVSDNNLSQMDCWLSWWHVRYPRWRKQFVGEVDDISYIPTTNLAETKHASWLAGEGNKEMLSLYDACVSDLSNALLQSVKVLAFMEGRYHGAGPSAEKLAHRAQQGRAPNPATIAREIEKEIGGTPMYQQPTVEGDNITVSRKRRHAGKVRCEEENSLHRPEYLTQNISRNRSNLQARTKMPAHTDNTDEGGLVVEETDIHKTMWAIRRIPQGSRVQCQGWLGPRIGKCKKSIKNTGAGGVAPSFWGIRTWEGGVDNAYGGGTKAQFMWFCSDSLDHTWHICNTITQCPARVPGVWPVEKGTNMTASEMLELEKGGFTLQKATPKEINNVRYRPGVSIQASKRIESAVTLEAQIVQHTVVKENVHEIFEVETSSSQVRGERYEVHIASNPICTCGDFAYRAAQSKPYMACKHIYFIFLRYFGLDSNHNMFVHQSKLTNEDLFRVFNCRRTA